MSRKNLAVAAALCIFAATGQAAVTNLVSNGSFENGLAGWTLTGNQGDTPAVAVNYGSATPYPTGAYGEAVAVDNATTKSPDAAGTKAAFFSADNAVNGGLSQGIFLSKGSYRIGFDAYAPQNGYGNAFDARFSAAIAGVTLADYLVSSNPATTWTNYSGLANILSDGIYNVSFLFNTPGQGFAKDVAIDRVFVLSSTDTGGVNISNVPEPGSVALVGLGLLGLAAARKRKAGKA